MGSGKIDFRNVTLMVQQILHNGEN